jgi:DNA primase
VKTDLEQLKSNPQVLRVYSNRVQLTKNGVEYSGKCPFHPDKNPSFTISSKDGKLLYKCFACSASGSVLDFVMGFDKVGFGPAIKTIQTELGNDWQENKKLVDSAFQPVIKNETKKLVIPLEKYYPLEQALANSKEAKEFLLKERGITYETAKRLHFGFRRTLGQICSSDPDSDKMGWISIPSIRNENVISIEYRGIAKKSFFRQAGMETGIFNIETVEPLEAIFITEGKFDAACLVQAGFRAISLPNASAKLPPEIKDEILQANQIILAGDSDQPGQEVMNRLWNELQERTYLLKWPEGWKDANQVLMEMCGGNTEVFKKVVNECVTQAKSNPMPSVFSLAESMASGNRTNLSEHPQRSRFPWPSVDKMAILLPGSVISLSATNTKMAKTTFVMNKTIEDAMKYDEVVLNYQCELSVDEYSNMVAAYLLKKNRNSLSKDDYKEAAKRMGDARYYIGRNPTLNTVTPVLDLIEAAIRRLGATTVVLDHLHFICRNETNEIQAQANAFQRIKNMAVRYGVKFIVVGQPRKANQASKGKVIHIADLKGSETFGSDADAIFVIHRDNIKIKDPTNPPKDDYSPQTEVHLLGARAKGDGGTFAVLNFIGEWAMFHEPSFQTPPEEDVLF